MMRDMSTYIPVPLTADADPRRCAQSTSGNISSQDTTPCDSLSMAMTSRSPKRDLFERAFRRYPMVVPQRFANASCSDVDRELRYSRKLSMAATLPRGNLLSTPAGHLPRGIRGYHDPVDIKAIRRKRLQQLIDLNFGKRQHAFADAVERSPNYISRIASGKKGIGEDVARDIEIKLELPRGWLDRDDSNQPVTLRVKYRWPFRIDAARFQRLRPTQKKMVEEVVERMIAGFEASHSVRPRKSAS